MAAAGCLLLACPVAAQVLEEITVTATKRAENAQEIPLSVVAIPGESLQEDIVRNLESLALDVPNLSVSEGLTTDNVFVRGVGSGNERSFEQSVGLFVDGIYMPRSRQYRAPFLDVERVEIARGPQSVLFGLNATAGAIAVHTARSRPGEPFVANLLAEYEAEFGGTALTAVIGGPAGARTGLRLAASVRDTGDGYWHNLATGRDENALEDRLMRASVVVLPTDAVTLDAKVEYSDVASDGGADELYTGAGRYSDGSDELDWVRGQDSGLLPLFPAPQRPGYDGEALNVAASGEFDAASGGTLTGILGYTDYDWSIYVDLDSGPLRIVDAGVDEGYEQASAELRYASADGRAGRFVLGAYYSTSELGQAQPNLVDGTVILAPAGFPVPGFDAGRLWAYSRFDQDETMSSLYGLLAWNVNDAVEIRGGVRYVASRKDHLRGTECLVQRPDGSFAAPDAGNPNDTLLLSTGFCPTPVDPPRRSRSSHHWLPELSVQWAVGPTSMLYAKAGTAAKSGGFVAARVVIPGYFEYDDETGLGYELGFKSGFAGGRGQVNVALFRTDYDDLQVNSFDPATAAAIVGNAGEVRTRGLELDARFALSNALTVGALLGLLDADYTAFRSGPCYPGEAANPDGFTCDKSGMRLPYAPEASGTAYLDLQAPLGSRFVLLGRLAVDFSDAYLTSATLDPAAEQDAYARVDARIGLGAPDGRWTVSLVGRNLGEERVNNHTEAFLGVYRGYMQEPRTVWLQGLFRFAD